MTWWLVPSGLCMPSQQSGIHSFFSEHDILGIWNLVMVENQEHVTAQGNSLCCVRESQFSIENEFPHTPKRNVYWMNLAKISFNRHSLPVEWILQNFHSTDIPSRSGHPPTNSAKCSSCVQSEFICRRKKAANHGMRSSLLEKDGMLTVLKEC